MPEARPDINERMNITLIGFMGTGKTVVGKRLARKLGWRFVDVDSLIVAAAKEPVAKIFAEHGERVFRRMETRTIRRVAKAADQVIATGGGAFMDPENRRLLHAVGPVICLSATPKAILQRVTSTLSSRPMLAGATSPQTRIQQLLKQRASAYAQADVTIDTSGLSVDQVVDRILEHLGPCLSSSRPYLLTHSAELSQRYGGKYIAVLGDRVIGVGATQLEAYRRIKRPLPSSGDVGVYYVPSRSASSLLV